MNVVHTALRGPARRGLRGRLLLVLSLSVVLAGLLPNPVQAGWLTETWPGYNATPNSEAARVLDIARRQLHKPWRFASIGPDAFDCSGLVWYTFREAGLADRIGGKRRGGTGYLSWFKANGQISRNLTDARAGDILIWGGGRHAGIYISGNWAISSLNRRYHVRIHRADPMGLPFTAVLLVHMSRDSDGPLPPSPSPELIEQTAPPSPSPEPIEATAPPSPSPEPTDAPSPSSTPAS